MWGADKLRSRRWLTVFVPAVLWGLVQANAISWNLSWLPYAEHEWDTAGMSIWQDVPKDVEPDAEMVEAEKFRIRREALSIVVAQALIVALLPVTAWLIHRNWSIPVLAVLLGLLFCFTLFPPNPVV